MRQAKRLIGQPGIDQVVHAPDPASKYRSFPVKPLPEGTVCLDNVARRRSLRISAIRRPRLVLRRGIAEEEADVPFLARARSRYRSPAPPPGRRRARVVPERLAADTQCLRRWIVPVLPMNSRRLAVKLDRLLAGHKESDATGIIDAVVVAGAAARPSPRRGSERMNGHDLRGLLPKTHST